MLPYNESIEPPAPFLNLVVIHPTTSERLALTAKLDTAADISAISRNLVSTLGLIETSPIAVEGYDGLIVQIPTYIIVLELPQMIIRNLRVIAIPEDYMLLGRDVLNLLYTKLNGPDKTFDVSVSPL